MGSNVSKARVQVRKHTYRGKDGWLLCGRLASGAPVRAFTLSEQEARRMAVDVRSGKPIRFDMQLERSAGLEQCIACSELDYAMQRPEMQCFCTPGQLEHKRARNAAATEAALNELQQIADMMRETAAGLREWQRSGCYRKPGDPPCGSSCVHPMHAANRLDKLAERISSTKKGTNSK